MNHNINFNLDTLSEGAVKERINQEMQKISSNIMDLNTDPEKERTLVIEVKMKPNKNRDTLLTAVQVKSKLVPQDKSYTTMLIGQDVRTGAIQVNELLSGTKGQMYFDDNGEIRTDIGDLVEDDQGDQIIDFNKRNAK